MPGLQARRAARLRAGVRAEAALRRSDRAASRCVPTAVRRARTARAERAGGGKRDLRTCGHRGLRAIGARGCGPAGGGCPPLMPAAAPTRCVYIPRMLFFGPRLPCPRCGRKSGKPRDAGHYLCPHCHEPGPWASPEQVAEWTDMAAARKEFEALLARVAAGEAPPAAGTVGALTARAHFRPGEPQEMAFEALDRRVETALADHQLGAEEERTLAALAPALGVGWETYVGLRPGLEDRLTIARANAGRLIALASTRLMTQGGEVVYA